VKYATEFPANLLKRRRPAGRPHP